MRTVGSTSEPCLCCGCWLYVVIYLYLNMHVHTVRVHCKICIVYTHIGMYMYDIIRIYMLSNQLYALSVDLLPCMSTGNYV